MGSAGQAGFSAPAGLAVRPSDRGGHGVFATRAFAEGELVERVAVLLVPREQALTSAVLGAYAFVWDERHVGLSLGCGSLYNHSFAPNVEYRDERRRGAHGVKRFMALRAIAAGEELTVNYNGDPDDDQPVGFRVREPGASADGGSPASEPR